MRILITGANRGLGIELARQFLNAGHSVAAGTRTNSNMDTLSQLKKGYPRDLRIITLDIEDENTIAYSAELIKEDWGNLDVIINNAGILIGRQRKFDELELDEFITSFKVNAFGPMMVIKHFAKILKKNNNSFIINITSEAANDFGGNDFPYSISKAALNMYSTKINNYLKNKGIRVLAIHPGWMRTDMGGLNAPGSPKTTAQNIMDIIEGRLRVDEELVFIDHTGKSMGGNNYNDKESF